MSNKEEKLKVAFVQYAKSILEMVNSIKLKNVNQAFSLTKANLTVLEDDIKKTFSSHEKTSFDYTEYN